MERLEIRRTIDACTPAETARLDAAFAGEGTGAAWWRLMDVGYTGNAFENLHVFRYADGSDAPRLTFSAQYFPALSIADHVKLSGAARALAAAALRVFGVRGLKLGCLLVHSLSSVASLDVPAGSEPEALSALAEFLRRFRREHAVNLAMVRSLGPGLAGRLIPGLAAAGWIELPGQPCNRLRFPDCASLDDFLARFPSHRRQRLRASLRKLDAATELETVRVRTREELAALLPQILELKAGTAERHRDALAIPIHERPEFFPRLFDLFGERAFLRVLRRRDGRLLGYFLAVADGARSRGISLGTRYPEGKEVDPWFNLALRTIGDLAEAGVREVNLGNGDDEIKARIGAEPEPQTSAITFFPAPLRFVARRLLVPRLKRV